MSDEGILTIEMLERTRAILEERAKLPLPDHRLVLTDADLVWLVGILEEASVPADKWVLIVHPTHHKFLRLLADDRWYRKQQRLARAAWRAQAWRKKRQKRGRR